MISQRILGICPPASYYLRREAIRAFRPGQPPGGNQGCNRRRLQPRRTRQRHTGGRAVDGDVVTAGGDGPALALRGPVGQQARIGVDGDALVLAPGARSTLPQPIRRWPLVLPRAGDIDLRRVAARPVAGVGDGEAGMDGVAFAAQLQIVIAEAGIGQAEAEGKQRRQALAVIPAIADVRAFDVVIDMRLRAGEIEQPVQLRTRRLVERSGEGDRQPARRD